MNMYATIADSLSPAELADLAQSFGLDMSAEDYMDSSSFITDEWLERYHGMVTSDHMWDAMWRFGIVLDNDRMERLTGYWVDPDTGSRHCGYYVPDDYDTTIPTVSLDSPPKLLTLAEQERAA